jgi:hypothetical protein
MRTWTRGFPKEALETPFAGAPRQYDILAFDTDDALPVALMEGTLGVGGDGRLVTGIKKLAQRFLIELLTDSSSVAGASDRGNDLIWKLRNNLLQTPAEVFSEFNIAMVSVSQVLTEQDVVEDLPNDERFLFAQLTKLVLQPGKVELNISLSSAARATRSLILPIPLAEVSHGRP